MSFALRSTNSLSSGGSPGLALLTLFTYPLLVQYLSLCGSAVLRAVSWRWTRIAQLCGLPLTNLAGKRDLAHRDCALIGMLLSLTEYTNDLLMNEIVVRHAALLCDDNLHN